MCMRAGGATHPLPPALHALYYRLSPCHFSEGPLPSACTHVCTHACKALPPPPPPPHTPPLLLACRAGPGHSPQSLWSRRAAPTSSRRCHHGSSHQMAAQSSCPARSPPARMHREAHRAGGIVGVGGCAAALHAKQGTPFLHHDCQPEAFSVSAWLLRGWMHRRKQEPQAAHLGRIGVWLGLHSVDVNLANRVGRACRAGGAQQHAG